VSLIFAFAVLSAALPAAAAPKPPLYQPDGNPCARTLNAVLSAAGRDVVASSGNSAVLLKIKNQGDTVLNAYYNADGRTIATSSGKALRLWDASTGRNLKVLREPKGFGATAFSPNGKQFAAVVGQDTIQIRDIASGRVERSFKLPVESGWRSPLAYNSDGSLLASANGTIAYVWDTATGREVMRTQAARPLGDDLYGWGHTMIIMSVRFTPNGQALLTSGLDSAIRLWDLKSGKHLRCYGEAGEAAMSEIDISPDGRQIAAIGNFHGLVRTWDAYTGRPGFQVDDPVGTERYTSIAFSPDGRSMLTAATNFTAALWDAKSGALLGLMRHPAEVQAARFSNDGRRIVTSVGSEAWVWDARHKNLALAARAANLQEEGVRLARAGDIAGADSRLREAQRANPDKSIALPGAPALNSLCWYGAVWGAAARVLSSCERANQLVPKNATYRDSRALARALTGNRAGAIGDYRFVIARWTEDGYDPYIIAVRQAWLDALLAGKNPFDEATLAQLRDQ
jgi:hypothetical protein